MRTRGTIIALALIAAPRMAFAEPADWRFCVATDFKRGVGYVTNAFQSGAARPELEAAIGRHLNERNLAFQSVQCPLPASRSDSLDRRKTAQTFIQSLGYRLEDLQ